MLGVIYLPVPSGESRNMAREFNAGLLAKSKPPHRVIECPDTKVRKWARRLIGNGVLKDVSTNERLYVVLHGIARENSINAPAMKVGMDRSATHGGNQLQHSDWTNEKLYTFEQLAEHCEKEGLNKGHRDLRLFMCSAGVPIPPPYGIGRSFAQEFREAMRRRGYGPMVVTGYLGDLKTTYGFVFAEDLTEPRHQGLGMDHLTASTFKQVQNADGNMVRARNHKVTFS